jgi:mono/diheme cytochrome c family protein
MHCPPTTRAVGLLLPAALLFTMVAAQAAEPTDEFFERQIRPLLAEKCFSCHARGQKKGKLSLESRAGIMAGGESGPAAVAGKPDESLLISAITHSGDVQMPPDDKLSDREIAAVKHWVELGLPWPKGDAGPSTAIRADGVITEQDRKFWSFQPVQNPSLPAVQRSDWPRQALDHFILNRLESEGLQPVGEADRRTYIRRATFDLLGLPPSEEEVAAFVSDAGSDAYERLVERLLDSPHYGERWARHWLDVARYAEDQAHTFEARRYASGYRYRDWVVDALNRNMPIDRFLMEQIAGDLLPSDDRMQRLPALGFFALGPVYYADAGCAPKAKADEYDDRIDTLCRGMLGLTVSCARCHDHKFDPIPTKDYYALAGVFASTEYNETPLAPPEVVKAYDDAQAQVKQAEQQHKEAEAAESRKLGESFASLTAQYLTAAWRVQNRQKVEPGYKAASAVEGMELKEFVLERWLQYLASDQAKKNATLKTWFELLGSQDAKQDLSGDAASVEAVQRAAETIQAALSAAIEERRAAEAKHREQLAALKEGEKPPEKPALAGETAELLKELIDNNKSPFAIPKDRLEKLLPEESKQVLAKARQAIEDLKKASPPKYPIAHSLTEGKPANSKVHLRGNHKDLGEEVPRRFLSILSPSESPPFTQGSGRLELAQAVANRDNPLTARVFVNRVWQHHFGRGLVGTPSNFGLLGERPTHPELLDHLASRFMASGWSLKQLHREIMVSATYRLASTSNPANHERDPDNRLLWRANRRRLDVESWRDAMLTVSGNLDFTLGGPSMELSSNNNRRTLYAVISRHELHPLLRLFDFPDANLTSERRTMTTVPMQQLFVLNSEFMVAQSRAIAVRLQQKNLPDDEARVDQLCRWVLGRPASESERRLGREFIGKSLPEGVSATEVKLGRWEQLSQALLSTNEFVFAD